MDGMRSSIALVVLFGGIVGFALVTARLQDQLIPAMCARYAEQHGLVFRGHHYKTRIRLLGRRHGYHVCEFESIGADGRAQVIELPLWRVRSAADWGLYGLGCFATMLFFGGLVVLTRSVGGHD